MNYIIKVSFYSKAMNDYSDCIVSLTFGLASLIKFECSLCITKDELLIIPDELDSLQLKIPFS